MLGAGSVRRAPAFDLSHAELMSTASDYAAFLRMLAAGGEHARRYGWSGGLGTDFFANPDGSFQIVLAQVEMGEAVTGLFAETQ
jgi:hypothetical protein